MTDAIFAIGDKVKHKWEPGIWRITEIPTPGNYLIVCETGEYDNYLNFLVTEDEMILVSLAAQ
jgi:hypothetical protein